MAPSASRYGPTPAAPAYKPPPPPTPEKKVDDDIDLINDEEMDDPDWYRDNEVRVPCYKFAETGLYNLSGLKNLDRDWTATGSGG